MEEPERPPARRLAGQVGHERALRPLREGVKEAVEREERHDGERRGGHREAGVGERVDAPAGEDHAAPADAVGESAAPRARGRLHEVVQRPEGGDRGEGDPRLLRAQQEEGVRGVAEGEEGQDAEVAPEPGLERVRSRARRRPSRGGARRRAGGALPARRGPGWRPRGRRGSPRERRRRAGRCVSDEGRGGQQRTHHRPRVVHRPLEAEGAATLLARHDLGQERVARRAADALAHAVEEAHREDVRGGGGERDQGARERRQRVAGHDERLAAGQAVRQAPGDDLERGRHRLGQPLDDAEEGRPRPQRAGQERRQQRVDHLAAGVGQQAHEAERADRAVQRRAHTRILVGCDGLRSAAAAAVLSFLAEKRRRRCRQRDVVS